MPQPANKHFPKRRSGLTLTILLLWLAAMVLIALNRQSVYDWWRLRDYQPSTAVASLASQGTMTDSARRIFYVNRPSLEDKAAFGKSCSNDNREQTIVLGCYHSNQQGIFLLNVDDPRLEGVEQVTAAHEMLHAAYDRLSSEERSKVNAMLQDYYQSQLQDERIKQTIDGYKQSEPNDVVNEMHSIFGTEIMKLPSGLEQYYKRYFTNRQAVVTFANKYQAEFSSRESKVKTYDGQLSGLKQQINAAQSSLDAMQSEIDAKRQELNRLREDGSISAYNTGVPVYNALVNDYNGQVQELKNMIARYNLIVAQRNAVALEEDQLVNALDSNQQTIKQ